MGDTALTALLLVMGTQELKVTGDLLSNHQCSDMGSQGTPLLTSQVAVMAVQLEVPEVAPMTQGCHQPVAQKALDDAGVRHPTPDAGDERYPACHPALRAICPPLLLREETCQITCRHEGLTLSNHWPLEQGSIMIIRIDIMTGAIGMTIALLLVLIACSEGVLDHRYLHWYLHLAFLGWIGHAQAAKMSTFALIMAIR